MPPVRPASYHQKHLEEPAGDHNSKEGYSDIQVYSGDGDSSGRRRDTMKIKPRKLGRRLLSSLFFMRSNAKSSPTTSSVAVTAPAAGSGGGSGGVTKKVAEGMVTSSGLGEASIYHALVVIFLEFFAWGLLTSPMITVLNITFPDHTFLMNGLIQGIKGMLSFLSAPLIGALSDIWGRKFFLLLTVFFTCAPIPLMKINTWWYFAMISISGVFAVTFSVVFAYVADVTDESDRSAAYGLVSATFAASLVTSPALGAYLEQIYSEEVVVAVATAIAILDVFFILVAVPESLPDKCRLNPISGSRGLTLEQVDPFNALRKAWRDRTILLLCATVFLSYLPEAGQYSCFFVYLRLVMDFSKESVAMFIAAIGILSVVAQTGLLTLLMKVVGSKHTIMIGLLFEMLQLMWYGFGSQTWMMWAAGVLAAVSSITYPAISAFVSMHADADKQGLVQGMITGMRGLCNGLGPAMFGLIFTLFHVDLTEPGGTGGDGASGTADSYPPRPVPPPSGFNITGELLGRERLELVTHIAPGPPFVFGALLVILALMVSAFLPEATMGSSLLDSHRHHQPAAASSPSLAAAPSQAASSLKARYYVKKKNDNDDNDESSNSDREYTMPLIHNASAL